MHSVRSFQRLSGLLAVIGGPLAWGSLLLGLSAVSFDFEQLSDPQRILALGSAAAPLLRWSFLLSMFGAYLLLIPLTIWLGATFGSPDSSVWRWYTFCGLSYLVLGALGAAILAAVWAALIGLAASSPPDQQPALLIAFTTATTIAEDGFQGVVQNLAGGIWWIGLGSSLRHQQRRLGLFTMVLGGLLLINAAGNLLNSEPLSLIGLTATVLLAPLWSIWIGLVIARQPLRTA